MLHSYKLVFMVKCIPVEHLRQCAASKAANGTTVKWMDCPGPSLDECASSVGHWLKVSARPAAVAAIPL